MKIVKPAALMLLLHSWALCQPINTAAACQAPINGGPTLCACPSAPTTMPEAPLGQQCYKASTTTTYACYGTVTVSRCAVAGDWAAIAGAGGSGTVTSVATTSPITGGTITAGGTIACATCVTSASSLTSTQIVTGAGSQGSQTNADWTIASHTLTSGASGIMDLSAAAATGLKIPVVAGAAPTVDGQVAVNSTTHGLVHGSNGTALVSAVAATGTGTATTCSNQFVSAVSAVAIPTCSTVTLAGAQFANQGTTTTVLHGNGSGNPSFGSIVAADIANATITATQLAAQYSKGQCTEVWGGSGTAFALTSGDDAISNNTCYNDSGVTRTITAVKCRSDVSSNTTTVNPTFGSAGTGTTILSSALTCGSSLAYSSTGTVSNASWTTGTGINPAMAGTLTGTSIALLVEYTF